MAVDGEIAHRVQPASGAAMPWSVASEAPERRQRLPTAIRYSPRYCSPPGTSAANSASVERRADRLQVAPVGRPGERDDLAAGIVDVVLLGDVITGLGQQVGQRVAHHGAAAMADVHRAGRIGGDIFDLTRTPAPDRRCRRRSRRRAGWRGPPRAKCRARRRLTKPGPAAGPRRSAGRRPARRPARRRARRLLRAAWRRPGPHWWPCRRARVRGRGYLDPGGHVVGQVRDRRARPRARGGARRRRCCVRHGSSGQPRDR